MELENYFYYYMRDIKLFELHAYLNFFISFIGLKRYV